MRRVNLADVNSGRTQTPKVWTLQRQIMGNLWPVLVSLPFTALGLWLIYQESNLLSRWLGLVVLGGIVAAVSLNWLGCLDNARMKAEFLEAYRARVGSLKGEKFFVGFAQPGFSSLLDPHQDIGFLSIDQDQIDFVGELFQVRLARKDCVSVSFRPNPHSLLGYGGWICIEGKQSGTPFRLQIEPREKSTLIQNKKLAHAVKKRLEAWLKGQ